LEHSQFYRESSRKISRMETRSLALEFTAQLQCFPGRSAVKRSLPKFQQEEKQ